MHKLTLKLIICCASLSLSTPALSQAMVLAPPGPGNHTVTRDVTEYTAREQALLEQIASKSNAGIELLAGDFQVWTSQGNDWQSKTDWLKQARQQPAEFTIRNLAVRLMDDFAVVSFVLDKTADRHQKTSSRFITDIWRQSSNQLTVRYIADLPEIKPGQSQNHGTLTPIQRK